jgi:N-acetylneuraminate synthase/sialic acid synthase
MGKKVVAARPLPAGHVLGPEDVCLKSPGDGLPPYELEKVIGATLLQPLNADDEIAYQLLKRTPELARS